MNTDTQLALITLSETAIQGEWTIGKIDHDGARIDCGDWEQVAYVWQTTRRYVPGDNLDATGPEFGVDNPQANAEFICALVNHFRATQSRPEAELPELPEPQEFVFAADGEGYDMLTAGKCYFTADQLRAYATEHSAYWKEMWRAANARGDGVGELVRAALRLSEVKGNCDPTYEDAYHAMFKGEGRDAWDALDAAIAKFQGTPPAPGSETGR